MAPFDRDLDGPQGDPAPRLAPIMDRRLHTPRAAGIAGLAFAALFVTSVVLLRSHPSAGSTASQVRDFYLREDAGNLALVGVYLAPFSGIAFLWFIAVVRNLIGDREDQFFATVFLGSGLLFVAMLFVAAGLGGALLAAVKFEDQPVPNAETVVTIRALTFGFLYVYAMRMAAVFMIVTSTIGMRLGVFPRWLVAAGFVAALVLMFNVSYIESLVLGFSAWVAAVSGGILPTRRSPSAAGAWRLHTHR